MISAIRTWLAARSVRERQLLLLLAVIALPLAAWLLVVRPLDRGHEAALQRNLEAVDRNGRIRLLAEAARTPLPARRPAADLELLVAESAARSGLVLDSNSPLGPGTVSVTIMQATPTAVIQWLAEAEGQGLRIEGLRMTPAGEGTVTLSTRLTRAAS
jgi:type II secretory pathway component PulM